MEFENSFNVPLPPAEAWKVLLDIPRIAPCMPGAELTEVVDGSTYKGKVSVRLGPVALAFAGTVKFEEVDEANRKARAKAQGTDAKGRGGANATVDFHLEPVPEGSKVVVKTNLNLSGAVAQYGRGVGMIKDTAQHLIGQFADCLKVQLAASAPSGASAGAASAPSGAPSRAPSGAAAAKPIGGFSLMLKVLWGAFLRLFGGRQ
ncbi:MAG TPA: SRPBCC family protein [Alphaproteobacteria bacterium]|nr:SRPBCC family protein [Alphaproteobacteria bacterium]